MTSVDVSLFVLVEDARSASGELASSSTPVSVSLGAPSLTLEACSFLLPPMRLSPVASECTSGAVPPSDGQEDPFGGPGPSGSLIAIGFSCVSLSNPHRRTTPKPRGLTKAVRGSHLSVPTKLPFWDNSTQVGKVRVRSIAYILRLTRRV